MPSPTPATKIFLSTPSARRATADPRPRWTGHSYFYPRPPRGGRHLPLRERAAPHAISIHALREEGDLMHINSALVSAQFLSTPSARRATLRSGQPFGHVVISIHALREEGDARRSVHPQRSRISIHALREEGDFCVAASPSATSLFLSTPSARRATAGLREVGVKTEISIHALREEGDSKNRDKISIFKQIVQHSARI